MQWYYSKAGVQHGPVPENELRAKLASGEVGTADLVWKDGMTDWIPASQVEALKVRAAETPPQLTGGGASPYASPATVAQQGIAPPTSNYLWQSIILIILCWPVGIPAVIYASKVDGMIARGDYLGAQSAAATAKMWCWIGYGGFLALVIVYILFFAVLFLSAAAA